MTTQISRNILLTLSYDGTNFSGWQRQGSMRENVDGHSPRTVQGIIETALEKLHRQATAVYG
ncbi:MAG: tRNA pseudouridine(38-40) synthase TruA, partial [Spirochaetaceae bacterium]|nr:tRNA pseudouridine(38-40) synthase TruA [Spirochaetaceae bacterium]